MVENCLYINNNTHQNMLCNAEENYDLSENMDRALYSKILCLSLQKCTADRGSTFLMGGHTRSHTSQTVIPQTAWPRWSPQHSATCSQLETSDICTVFNYCTVQFLRNLFIFTKTVQSDHKPLPYIFSFTTNLLICSVIWRIIRVKEVLYSGDLLFMFFSIEYQDN